MKKLSTRWTSSPWGFRYYDFAAYCDFMRSQGIEDLCALLGSGSDFPLAISNNPGQLQEVISISHDKGIHIVEAAALNGSHDENLKLCHLLGCKYYRICGVFDDSPAIRKQLVDELRDSGELAAEFGITVILENHGGLLTKASTCREILEEVGLENVRLNFDAANFAYYGQCPYKAWDELKDLTAFTHLKSLNFDNGKPYYCRVNDGIIDYERLAAQFRGYDGFFCVEYEYSEDVEQGTADDLQALRKIMGKL